MAKSFDIFKKNNRALSTVIGVILFMLISVASASLLFVSIYNYNNAVNQGISIEESRKEERINLVPLFEDEYNQTVLTVIRIQNSGSITSHIRAVYVNNEFWCDPSNVTLNLDGSYIAPQTTKLINIKPMPFDPTAKITVATERGVKAIEYQSFLIDSQNQTSNPMNTNYGPLRLNYTLFTYHETDGDGDFTGNWWDGWRVQYSTDGAWNVTVTNIDNRNITLNEFCCLTLVSNDGGLQYVWYINDSSTTIQSNQTVSLIYNWKEPITMSQAVQDTPRLGGQAPTYKVFLTFFGTFSDNSTYGQTIPFEAVLVTDYSLNIVASPDTIAAGSSMNSTITATIQIDGTPVPNAQVTFSTTLGTLSTSSDVTNAAGEASVYLSPGSTPGIATITVTWEGMTNSTFTNIVPATLDISASPETIVANTTETSQINATLFFDANPLSGEQVTFTTTLGSLSDTSPITDDTGTVQITLSPDETAGTAEVTVTWRGISNATTVTITGSG